MLTVEQKLVITLCHICPFIGLPIIAPLAVLLASDNGFVRQQAKEALAFQIGLMLMVVAGIILTILLVGVFVLIAVGIAAVVFPIMAVVKISDGVDYSYPITGKFVRQ